MKSANDVSIPLDVKMFKQQQLLWNGGRSMIPPQSGLRAEIGDAVEEATACTMNNQ